MPKTSLKRLDKVLKDKNSLLTGGRRKRKSKTSKKKCSKKMVGGKKPNEVFAEHVKMQAFIRKNIGIKGVPFVSKFKKLYTDKAKKDNPTADSITQVHKAQELLEADIKSGAVDSKIKKIKSELGI